MTDLEIIKRCAAAMGIKLRTPRSNETKEWPIQVVNDRIYDPLHDDAQAMALEDWLAERGCVIFEYGDMFEYFTSELLPNHQAPAFMFAAPCPDKKARRRLVCECVAKMGKAKP